MKKPKFHVGMVVLVHTISKVQHKQTNLHSKTFRVLVDEHLKDPIRGIVVGGKYVRLGTVTLGCGHYDDYEPAYLSIESTEFVLLVRFGFMNKEVMVKPDNAMIYPEPSMQNVIPYVYRKPVLWTERELAYMSEQSKSYPRDKQGRFIKG